MGNVTGCEVSRFLSPRRWRAMIASVAALDDRSIRRFGLGSMLFGVVMLYLVN